MNILKKVVSFLCYLLPSWPTRFLYRLCGYRIGKNTKMPVFSYIFADEMAIGNDVNIRRLVYIRVRRLTVGANTIISYGSQIKGVAGFTCGDNCFIGIHCLIHCAEDVTLGFYSGFGPRSTVYTHGSFLPLTMGYPAKFAPVVLEDFVWVGMEVTIMPGAHIERNCIINPGVVIQGRVKSDSFVQLDAKQYVIHDLSRLQKISKKDTAYWHDRIITTFLNSKSVAFEYDAQAKTYAVPGRFAFVSHPETNSIELLVSGKKIIYDLEHYDVTASRREFHREFLDFIRLYYGLTLRTRYR